MWGLMLLVGVPASAQSPAPVGVTTASDSLPVLTANFVVPSHSIDWQHYPRTEDCRAAVERTLDSLSLGVPQDTVLPDVFAPLPPLAIQVGRECLRHFTIDTLSLVEQDALMTVAGWTGADSIVQGLVTHHLATLKGAPAPQRAAVLASAVNALMRRYRTPRKTQLARALMAQGDALGPEATIERLAMHEAVEQPVGTYDPDALLAYDRTVIALLQQASPAFKAQWARVVYGIHGRIAYLQMQASWLQWLKTGADADYHTWLAAYHDVMLAPDSLIGTPAMPITGAYWFNRPQSGMPSAVPAPGKVTLLLFVDPQEWQEKDVRNIVLLQHLHQQFPLLQIVLLARNTGALGGKLLVDAPEREADMIHAYLSDSLHMPGMVGIEPGTYQRLPNGAIRQVPSANMLHYEGGYGHTAAENSVLIDAHGRIIKDMVLGELDQLPQLEYLIRQLQWMATLPGTAVSRTP